MPKRHGLYRNIPEGLPKGTRLTILQAPVFRCGFSWVFETLRLGPFLTNPVDKIRIGGLKYHFDEVFRRFLFSLQHLNDLMRHMVAEYERGPMNMKLPKINFEAECQADHVLTYLNSILDDIAHSIIFATGFVTPPKLKHPIDSMGGLKKRDIRSLPALAPVAGLLSELDDANSWWELAFKTGVGARQLLIHNQHMVTFQAAQSPGCPMEATAFLVSPGGRTPMAGDFSVRLREILSKLCDWLDRLEAILTASLPVQPPPAWFPSGFCPCIGLPLGHPQTGLVLTERHFPLPLCDGSDPLPWRFGPPTFEA